MMNRGELSEFLHLKESSFFKITIDNQLAGYIIFFIENGAGYMESIAVEKSFRGQGVAGMALNFMTERLRQERIPGIKLHVRRDNKAAIFLYEKHGFVQAGIEDGFYADGSDAYVYTLFFDESAS